LPATDVAAFSNMLQALTISVAGARFFALRVEQLLVKAETLFL
jgi:hypothetical protein